MKKTIVVFMCAILCFLCGCMAENDSLFGEDTFLEFVSEALFTKESPVIKLDGSAKTLKQIQAEVDGYVEEYVPEKKLYCSAIEWEHVNYGEKTYDIRFIYCTPEKENSDERSFYEVFVDLTEGTVFGFRNAGHRGVGLFTEAVDLAKWNLDSDTALEIAQNELNKDGYVPEYLYARALDGENGWFVKLYNDDTEDYFTTIIYDDNHMKGQGENG